MRKDEFRFELPGELIAQSPASPRDSSRLLCLAREGGAMEEHVFSQLPQLLRAGDVLVLNNSRVIPARLTGVKPQTGGVCELLLLREAKRDEWLCMARPAKSMREGALITFGDGSLTAVIISSLPDGQKLVHFQHDCVSIHEKLDQFGTMPLPPYIRAQLADASDYQTVYAKIPGSAAAPTAGLHFTPRLLAGLREAGIETAELTLHVGTGTFRPVKAKEIEDHTMHSEWYCIPQDAADTIRGAKGRVIAVGTTACRTLEASFKAHGEIVPCSGETDIFIYPGYTFRAIQGLITNFHLPESTLIMLVSAFCGRENILRAYRRAVRERYRFFSFGDAMLII